MEWIKRRWGTILIVGLAQAAVGWAATLSVEAIVDNALARDIGIIVLWACVILGGAGLIIVRTMTQDFIRSGDTVSARRPEGPAGEDRQPSQRERRRALKERLRMARNQGEDMLGVADPDMVWRWARRTAELISDSLGDDEASLFYSDQGFPDIPMEDLGRRLYRLDQLIERVDSLKVKRDFI